MSAGIRYPSSNVGCKTVVTPAKPKTIARITPHGALSFLIKARMMKFAAINSGVV